jgi:hypothetical protein
MFDGPSTPIAWVIAVRMGYGHQRTVHPLRHLAPGGEVLLADDYPEMPDSDRRLWDRMRRFYEFISKVHDVRLIGRALFKGFDEIQRILSYYPRRDLSQPDMNVRTLYRLLGRGWGRHLIETLKARGAGLPIITSFYTPAFMAEFFDYPGDIYCIVCDADIARAWAALQTRSSRIRYFAPTQRAADRLREYGVPQTKVFLTGYPLPEENVGEGLAILKQDLAARIPNLDPRGQYRERYGTLVAEKVGKLAPGPTRPLTILFSIGGAGAQAEIAAKLVRSLKQRILSGEVRLIVSAGIKPWVRDYVARAISENGLDGAAQTLGSGGVRPSTVPVGGDGPAESPVRVLIGDRVTEYFDMFDKALRTTDILWTKPSELSFYSALGLPIVMAPPVGSQEKANQEWLLRLGAGTAQDDPANAHEWLFDLLDSGWFAEAALEGFVECETSASRQIRAIVASGGAVAPTVRTQPTPDPAALRT